ncbi:MAG: sigma-70 family RNA polymerase sigma factor, partial [Planctomycetaceae bacterium]|nr:sigma-70 family RNA polymerase sigma factor [Planctomycetaceae bacterium]
NNTAFPRPRDRNSNLFSKSVDRTSLVDCSALMTFVEICKSRVTKRGEDSMEHQREGLRSDIPLNTLSTHQSIFEDPAGKLASRCFVPVLDYATRILRSKRVSHVDPVEISTVVVSKMSEMITDKRYDYEHRPSGTRFRDYLKEVIRTGIVDAINESIRARELPYAPIDEMQIAGVEHAPLEQMIDQFRVEVVMYAIDVAANLSERERYAFKERMLAEACYEEIAADLNCDADYVRTVLVRSAKRKVRTYLEDVFGPDFEEQI